MKLAQIQQKFFTAVMSGVDGDIAPHLALSPPQLRRRLNIHRRNYQMVMTDTLRHTYPIVSGVLQKHFNLAKVLNQYVAHNPPTSPLLADYGEGFSKFLNPTSQMLSRLAALEWQAAQITRGSLTPALTPSSLRGLTPTQLERLCFRLHPLVRVFRERYDFFALWSDHRTTRNYPLLTKQKGFYHFILARDKKGVLMYNISDALWRLATTIAKGEGLTADGDFQNSFSQLLKEGMLVAISKTNK